MGYGRDFHVGLRGPVSAWIGGVENPEFHFQKKYTGHGHPCPHAACRRMIQVHRNNLRVPE